MRAVWNEVLDLMWEAYRAGTIPVGAVVADETGTIVGRGRNRIFSPPFDGQLSGTRLAHAEVNALASLSSDGTHERLTLYSSLEPCHLCLSAAVAVRVGTVRFAGADPYAGAVGRLIPSVDHQRHPLAVEGPLPDETGRVAEALHVAHFLWRIPDGSLVAFYSETRPEVVAAVRAVPPPDAEATLADALAALA